MDKTKADAAAQGHPDYWTVDTSWAEELDAPISVITVGPGDPKKTEEILDAWAEYFVNVWFERRKAAAEVPRG